MTNPGLHSHPNANAVREKIHESQRVRSLWTGLASFTIPLLAWAALVVAVICVPWWAKIPIGFLNGIAIGVMFIVGHDACHGALLPRRWMNRFAGRVSLMPSLHPYTAWTHNHNGLHHGFTNIKEKDPGFPPLSLAEYQRLPAWNRFLYRQYRTWYGLGLLYFCDMWLKWEMLPSRERAPRKTLQYNLDRLLILVFAACWVGALAWGATAMNDSILLNIATGFVFPQIVWNWLIGFIILQQHTHPRVPWYSEADSPEPSFFQAQVKATPHLVFPAPFRFLMRHVMEHTAHHTDTSIPLYKLPEAQANLEKNYRREMVRVMWSPAMFMKTLRTCRLYDYSNHRWQDYNGTYLTAPLLESAEVESSAG